jgi:hypothetical protein
MAQRGAFEVVPSDLRSRHSLSFTTAPSVA